MSGVVRDKGDPYTNIQHIPANNSRLAVGTLETWNAIVADYTAWNNEYIGGGPSVFNYNGYQYSVSTFVKTEYSTYLQTNYFYICRKSL